MGNSSQSYIKLPEQAKTDRLKEQENGIYSAVASPMSEKFAFEMGSFNTCYFLDTNFGLGVYYLEIAGCAMKFLVTNRQAGPVQ